MTILTEHLEHPEPQVWYCVACGCARPELGTGSAPAMLSTCHCRTISVQNIAPFDAARSRYCPPVQ